jgi:hypothetical protein
MVVQEREVSLRMKPLSLQLVFLLLVTILATSCFGGTNPSGKVAIHVRAHPTPCPGGFPVFTGCSEIQSSYTGCGEIDILTVFFDLNEYTGVEFGLRWPVEWGSMSWVLCNGDAVSGYIMMPGDGVGVSWSICQRTWAVAPGYGWTVATSPGYIWPTINPATECLGTLDCSSSPGPHYDWSREVYWGGACGQAGANPCSDAIEPAAWGSIKAMFK